MKKTALLLIDIQNDYFPGGKWELVESEKAAFKAREILNAFRKQEAPVIHIQHLSIQPSATFFLPGTTGAEIHSSVTPLQNEMVIQKSYPNSFRETSLLKVLKEDQVTQLCLCGMMTHMCVAATARAAFDFGFEVSIVEDACTTRDLPFQKSFLPASQVHNAILASLDSTYASIVKHRDILKS